MFEHATFEAITGGDAAVAREIVDLFRQDTGELLRKLEAAVQSRDEVLTRRIGHTLKSSSGSLGALQMSGLAALIESRGVAAAIENLAPLQAAFATTLGLMEASFQPV